MEPGHRHFRNRIMPACCAGWLLVIASPAGAVDVYQWVDENGVIHFSQFAPADVTAEVNKRTLIDEAPRVDPEEDLYAVEQTARDMQAYRDELEKKRDERRERQANAPQPIVVQQHNDDYGYPYWLDNFPHRPRPPGWKPGRPGHGPGSGPRPTPTPQPPASSGFKKPGG